MSKFFHISFITGVGIDDMFVIMQSINNIGRNRKLSIEDKIGKALKSSGMSVLITSVTDVFAFAIGAITVDRYFLYLFNYK